MNLGAFQPETPNAEPCDRTKSLQVPEGTNALLWSSSLHNYWNSLIILSHFPPPKIFKHDWVSLWTFGSPGSLMFSLFFLSILIWGPFSQGTWTQPGAFTATH